jgi:flagellar motility protein MotE (MotC chaperone)
MSRVQTVAALTSVVLFLSTTVYKFSSLSATVEKNTAEISQVSQHAKDTDVHLSKRDIQRLDELMQKVEKLDEKLDRVLENQADLRRVQPRPRPVQPQSAATAKPSPLPTVVRQPEKKEKPEDVVGIIKYLFGKLPK